MASSRYPSLIQAAHEAAAAAAEAAQDGKCVDSQCLGRLLQLLLATLTF